MGPPGDRRNNGRGSRFGNRNQAGFPYASSNSSYDGLAPANSYNSTGGMNGIMGAGMSTSLSYQPQPIGTPLSPFAPEFTSSTGNWKTEVVKLFVVDILALLMKIRQLQRRVKPSFRRPSR